MQTLLSYRAYARRKGVSLSSVQYAISTGRITPKKNSNGILQIDPEEADRDWDENTNHSKRSHNLAAPIQREISAQRFNRPAPTRVTEDNRPVGQKEMSYQEARTLREIYAAKLTQLEYEERTKLLVNAEEVTRQWFNIARTTRDAILNIPDRVAGELAAENDPYKVYQLLKRELTQSLEAIVNDGINRVGT